MDIQREKDEVREAEPVHGVRMLQACDKDEYRLELLETACAVGWLALRHADKNPPEQVQRTVFDVGEDGEPEPEPEHIPVLADAERGLEIIAEYVAAKRAGNAKLAEDLAAEARDLRYWAACVSPTVGFAMHGISNVDDALRAIRMCEASAKMVARRRREDDVAAVQQERIAMDTIADTVVAHSRSLR